MHTTIQHESADTRRFVDQALPHLDAVFTRARFLLRDIADAEAATEQCYLRALLHFDSCRGQNVRFWLFAILKHLCRTQFAGRTPGPKAGEIPGAGDTILLLRPDHERRRGDMPDGHRQDRCLRQIIDALPPPLREALMLREFDKFSYREIAILIDEPVRTVMARLASARALLCVALAPEVPVPVEETRELVGQAD